MQCPTRQWVGKELRYAIKVQRHRNRSILSSWLHRLSFGLIEIGSKGRRSSDQYPIIPLSLDGTKPDVLKQLFGAEPAYIPVTSAAGGIDAALHAILVALASACPRTRPRNGSPRPSPSKSWCWS